MFPNTSFWKYNFVILEVQNKFADDIMHASFFKARIMANNL
jgi:hypothetical protein